MVRVLLTPVEIIAAMCTKWMFIWSSESSWKQYTCAQLHNVSVLSLLLAFIGINRGFALFEERILKSRKLYCWVWRKKKIVRFMLFNSRCRCFVFLLSMMRMVIHLFVQSEMKAENLFRQMNFGTCDRLTRDVGGGCRCFLSHHFTMIWSFHTVNAFV